MKGGITVKNPNSKIVRYFFGYSNEDFSKFLDKIDITGIENYCGDKLNYAFISDLQIEKITKINDDIFKKNDYKICFGLEVEHEFSLNIRTPKVFIDNDFYMKNVFSNYGSYSYFYSIENRKDCYDDNILIISDILTMNMENIIIRSIEKEIKEDKIKEDEIEEEFDLNLHLRYCLWI